MRRKIASGASGSVVAAHAVVGAGVTGVVGSPRGRLTSRLSGSVSPRPLAPASLNVLPPQAAGGTLSRSGSLSAGAPHPPARRTLWPASPLSQSRFLRGRKRTHSHGLTQPFSLRHSKGSVRARGRGSRRARLAVKCSHRHGDWACTACTSSYQDGRCTAQPSSTTPNGAPFLFGLSLGRSLPRPQGGRLASGASPRPRRRRRGWAHSPTAPTPPQVRPRAPALRRCSAALLFLLQTPRASAPPLQQVRRNMARALFGQALSSPPFDVASRRAGPGRVPLGTVALPDTVRSAPPIDVAARRAGGGCGGPLPAQRLAHVHAGCPQPLGAVGPQPQPRRLHAVAQGAAKPRGGEVSAATGAPVLAAPCSPPLPSLALLAAARWEAAGAPVVPGYVQCSA